MPRERLAMHQLGAADSADAGATPLKHDLLIGFVEPTGTLLRLTHSALEPAPVAEHHREGWERYLERLRERAEGRDPGPDSPEM